jgi:NAD(P)-dependent dehydrogenase (short-subunit alcohol dehydrogenase family)
MAQLCGKSNGDGDMLTNKRALITGATAGIGTAVARVFAARGASLVLTGRNLAAGAALAAELGAQFVAQDVCADGAPAALMAACGGRLDILVNNAGVLRRGDSQACTDEDFDFVFAANVRALFRLSRAAVPVMAAGGGGAIINIASDWGIVAAQGAVAYGASKGAVVQLTRSMAADHARQGIRVNAVCPGDTDTLMLDGGTDSGRAERLRAMGDALPLGRVGQPEDVAYAVAFLASDEAAFITGALLPVDGGNTAV